MEEEQDVPQNPEGMEGVAAEEGTADVEAGDAVAALFGGESPGEAAVIPLKTPWL